MKKMLSSLLVICLIIGVATPASAVNLGIGKGLDNNIEEQQPPNLEETAPTVATLTELQAAIAVAEDGGSIAIAHAITLNNESIETDKDITITRASGFTSSMFYIYGKCTISGFNFQETADGGDTIAVYEAGDGVIVQSCTFNGHGIHTRSFINVIGGVDTVNNVCVKDCSFDNNEEYAVDARANTNIFIDSCAFRKNKTTSQGGAVNSAGALTVKSSTITENTANVSGGIFCSGNLTITESLVRGNISLNPDFGADIFSTGTLSIADTMHDTSGYYEMTTGEKVPLPLEEATSIAKLSYFSTEEAKEYFKPDEPTPAPEPEPDDGDDSKPETPPPTDNDEQDVPQEPQEPSGGDDDSQDDDFPLTQQKPTEAPIMSLPPIAPLLACGDAIIDTTRSVVLAGYGDGLLHEDDPLTRAQLATIIYRLLDSETIEKYGTDVSQFADVDSNDWCARYISTLAKAGVVNGIDNVNYAPSGLVTWAQALTVLSRFVEQQETPLVNIQYDGWALKAIQTAVANHWIVDSAEFKPDALITRGELVNLLSGILEQY